MRLWNGVKKVKHGTTRLPKTKALARALRVRLPEAVGILDMLWDYAQECCPDGGIGRLSDQDIAEACGWPASKSHALIAALTSEASRWLDPCEEHRFYLHDWHQHCEDFVHRKLARGRKWFANGSVPNLTRLEKSERTEAEKFYFNNAPDVRTECAQSAPNVQQKCAQSAPDVRPKCALPVPVPIPIPVPSLSAPPEVRTSPIQPDEFEAITKRIWDEHPTDRRDTLQLCQQYATAALLGAVDAPALLRQAAINHTRWCITWEARGGFADSLKTWWTKGHWLTDPGDPRRRQNPAEIALDNWAKEG